MSKHRRIIRPAGVLLAATTATLGFGSLVTQARAATPTETGCPASYELLSVTWLESQGPYQLPRQLDESGNNDGFVCGRKTEDHAATNFCGGPCPAQIYDFTDNHRTPSYH